MKVNIKDLPKSEIEIEGELPHDIFESYFGKALERIGAKVKIDGFRKGKVPENILLEKVGEMHVLEEMAELALSDLYPKILSGEIEVEKIDPVRGREGSQRPSASNGIDAVGRPEISITKLARQNPLGFKIKTAVLPEVALPDYKNIAKKVLGSDLENSKRSDLEVSEKDVEDTILDIRKSRAPKVHITSPPTPPQEEGASSPSGKTGDGVELPEFNDEFVKSLGPFEGVEDFKTKLKENIKLEKGNQAREKTRLKIIEKILEDTKIEIPEILIDAELEKILHKMESDIAQMGLKFEDYLKHLNKTTEDLRKDFKTDAEKRAKLSLVLHEIGKAEKITADPEQVASEVAMILEHYKEADPERAQMHAENTLTNEKIFQFLESQ
ncbi:MAG: trigger factor [Patescibacteria group bacterium]